MKEPSQMTVLGVLMQREAEQSQPESICASSWEAISQAVSQKTPTAARPAPADPFLPGRARSEPDTNWNPRTAFNPQNEPRSSWHYPSRHFIFQTVMLVLVMIGFLAVGILLGPGGFKRAGQTTVTIPEDTIPLATSGRPSLDELQAFLTAADSTTLAGLPALPAERQRSGLEDICSRAGITLTQLPATGGQTYTYWAGRSAKAVNARSLLLLAREKVGEPGWTVVYRIVPTGLDLPAGEALDSYFADLLADMAAG